MSSIKTYIYKKSDLKKLLKTDLKKLFQKSTIITLDGDLGAGKTTFSQEYLKVLGVSDYITSPTYSYVHLYRVKELSIAHFDLYRFTDENDFFALGFQEYFNGSYDYIIIEWPERISHFLKNITHTALKIEHYCPSSRKITVIENK